MNPRPGPRTELCTRQQALVRLRQAEAALDIADLVLDDGSLAMPGVAASLTVIAGIVGSDAACCARLGKRPRGEDHRQAIEMLSTVSPYGPEMAKDLRRLITRKDSAHYGMAFVSASEAKDMVGWARRLVGFRNQGGRGMTEPLSLRERSIDGRLRHQS